MHLKRKLRTEKYCFAYPKITEGIISTSVFFFFLIWKLSEIRHLFGIQKTPSDTGQYRTSSFLTVKLISVTEFGENLSCVATRETPSTFI